MATGHRQYETKSNAELFKVLGEGDTPKLYARKPHLVATFDIAYAGGNSVDGRNLYVDRTIYRDIQAGIIRIPGLDKRDILQALCEHEHTEWAIAAGDNPVDSYPAAHEYANAQENIFVAKLGTSEDRYNAAWKPYLIACAKRFIKLGSKVRVPRDLWCGPYLDEEDAETKAILRILRAKGVVDASKVSKRSVSYGIGENECRDCAMFHREQGPLGTCNLVAGPIRDNRWCKRWTPAKGK